MSARFSLDTNVLFYAFDRDNPCKRARARDLVDRAQMAACVLPFQVIGEFVHSVCRKGKVPRPEAAMQAADWLDLFEIAAASPADFDRARALFEVGRLSYWDALLVSTVAGSGCTLLLSEDMQDRAEHAGVTVRNPFAGPELPDDIAALFA